MRWRAPLLPPTRFAASLPSSLTPSLARSSCLRSPLLLVRELLPPPTTMGHSLDSRGARGVLILMCVLMRAGSSVVLVVSRSLPRALLRYSQLRCSSHRRDRSFTPHNTSTYIRTRCKLSRSLFSAVRYLAPSSSSSFSRIRARSDYPLRSTPHHNHHTTTTPSTVTTRTRARERRRRTADVDDESIV